jgi:exoribonuclease R
MSYYNDKYRKIIEPLYGEKRDLKEDNLFLESNITPHMYNIHDRTDMTMYNTYSIDPDGCEDADDAFSIYEENEKLFLAIHIADPTEYINIRSSLWHSIEKRVVTRYPSNTPPIHMIPKEIMDKASLMVNQYGNIKLAITILTEIHKNTYEPMGGIQILFTKIKVEKENALTYKQAGKDIDFNKTLLYGLRISKSLYTIRSGKTKGTLLNEVSYSVPRYDNNTMYLYSDTKYEIAMKQMIAEYAIFANTFIGEYLKINFDGAGLYRICNAKEWLNTVYSDITGPELLNDIIVNGIKAEYISSVKPHDLVGAPEYTHFTSPIRRLSDCVCHYLLKYIHLINTVNTVNINNHLPAPFSNDQLKKYSDDCLKITKVTKNIQYKDTKFRLIQTMNDMLLTGDSITIRYYVTSYKSSFLNIIINKINEHAVYLSYTLRIAHLQTEYILKEEKLITIREVNCIGKFDEGSIPELDKLFIKT